MGINAKRTISEEIAYFVKKLDMDSIPTEVFDAVRAHMIDTVGVALLSSESAPTSALIKNMVLAKDSKPECTIWGSRERVALEDAVLCNGTIIHGLDFDDTHTGAITHPSASILAIALALGEKLNKSGEEIMTAAVAGYEVIVRLGLAAHGKFHDAGFHPSGILAPFAGVCVAAKLMDLDENTIVNALGIAGSQAGTIMEFLHDGSWVKMIHPGWGALSALYAVDCAKAGFTGPRTVFEGQYGVYPIHIGGVQDLPEYIASLGEKWYTPEIAFKLYPTCHHTHSFIDVMLSLMEKNGFGAEDIQAITAWGTPMCASQVCDPKEVKIRPQTEYMMKFSLYYVIAMTALHRRISKSEINLEYASKPEVIELMDRITFISDASVAVPGHMPAKMKVTLKDGRVFEGEQKYEKSAKENPITLDDVIVKYRGCTADILSSEKSDAILNSIFAFSGEGAADRLLACMAER